MRIVLPAAVFLLAGCSVPPEVAVDILPPARSVTRAEVQRIADAYATLRWNGECRMRMHGNDPQGQRVDTPDAAHDDMDWRFWWTLGGNVGMPYKWGGFDTPKEFLHRLHNDATVYAGDYASATKIAGGDDAVSRYAAGIDCSGFVSRCWRLERPYPTRELAALCRPLSSVDELKPGDIMLLPGVHVWLFLRWEEADHRHMVIVESGGVPEWKCAYKSVDTRHFLDEGYRPYRYLRIRE